MLLSLEVTNFVRVPNCRKCTIASGVRVASFFYLSFQTRKVLGTATLVPLGDATEAVLLFEVVKVSC